MEPDPLASWRNRNITPQSTKQKAIIATIAVLLPLVFTFLFATGALKFNASAETTDSGNTAKSNGVQAELKVDAGDEVLEYSVNVDKGASALDVIEQVSDETDMEFKYIEDPAFGEVIESVNGKEAKDSKLWAFKVNGRESGVGLSHYEVQKGDKISVELEEY